MNNEDDEFNRIERESKMRVEAVYQELQKYREKMLKRTWVGLTDEHKEGLIYMTDPNPEPHHLRELIDAVEFQLKEKNT